MLLPHRTAGLARHGRGRLIRVVLGHKPYLDLRTLIGLAFVSAPVEDPAGPDD